MQQSEVRSHTKNENSNKEIIDKNLTNWQN